MVNQSSKINRKIAFVILLLLFPFFAFFIFLPLFNNSRSVSTASADIVDNVTFSHNQSFFLIYSFLGLPTSSLTANAICQFSCPLNFAYQNYSGGAVGGVSFFNPSSSLSGFNGNFASSVGLLNTAYSYNGSSWYDRPLTDVFLASASAGYYDYGWHFLATTQGVSACVPFFLQRLNTDTSLFTRYSHAIYTSILKIDSIPAIPLHGSSFDAFSVVDFYCYTTSSPTTPVLFLRLLVPLHTSYVVTSNSFSITALYTNQGYLTETSYNDGYKLGLDIGYQNGFNEGNSSGYESGFSAGNTSGYNTGFSAGVASANDYTFLGLFGAVLDAPISAIRGLLGFDVFGVNLSVFVFSLFSFCIVVTIIRHFV